MNKPSVAIASIGLSVGLLAMLSSPSLAQAQYPDEMRSYMRHEQPIRQHLRELPDTLNGPHHEVVVSGRVVGADPDPNIRAQLRFGHGRFGEW